MRPRRVSACAKSLAFLASSLWLMRSWTSGGICVLVGFQSAMLRPRASSNVSAVLILVVEERDWSSNSELRTSIANGVLRSSFMDLRNLVS